MYIPESNIKHQYRAKGVSIVKRYSNSGKTAHSGNKHTVKCSEREDKHENRKRTDSAGRVEYVDAIKDSSTVHRTSYEYDGLGRVIKITNNDGTYKTTSYDDVANKSTETDEENNIKETYYNNVNKVVTEITYPDELDLAKKSVVQYEYNGLDLVKKLIDRKRLI